MITMIMWHRLLQINMSLVDYNQRPKLTFFHWWKIESLELKSKLIIHFKVILFKHHFKEINFIHHGMN